MTELLDAVGTLLASAGHGTLGTNLFLAKMPEAPDLCACVYEYEGETPAFTMGPDPIALERPRIQVMVRGPRDDYPTARDRAVAIRATLAAVTDVTLSGLRVLRIEPVGRVGQVGVDTGDRPRIAVNFRVIHE